MFNDTPLILVLDIMQWIRGMSLSIKSCVFFPFINKYREETCYKCKRNCKSRAALFLNGHWIHYISDKLSEEDINNIEHKDTPYKCKSCKPCKAIQIKSPSDTFQSGDMKYSSTCTTVVALFY
jgi:ferredoxin